MTVLRIARAMTVSQAGEQMVMMKMIPMVRNISLKDTSKESYK